MSSLYPIVGASIFGDGSDLDVTISVNTTLSRVMVYRNLTINASVAVNVANYPIFVLGVLTLKAGASITCNGNNGNNGGLDPSATGGAARTATYYGASGAGANGGGSGGGSAFNITNGWYSGANGAGGGFGSAGAGGAGAAVSNPAANVGGTVQVAYVLHSALSGLSMSSNTRMNVGGGGGGGGGGSGRLGGGGGSGAGVVGIFARYVVVESTALISAVGGNGGSPLQTGSTGQGGGGGGGGGVVLWCSTTKLSQLPGLSVTVAGGTGGAGTGGASSGGTGGSGLILEYDAVLR